VTFGISVTFPDGLEKVAFAQKGDPGARVELQTSPRLKASDARAWATYYEAIADLIEEVNEGIEEPDVP
jgi:hypothetical protein